MGMPIDPPARPWTTPAVPVPVRVRHTATPVMADSKAAVLEGVALAWTAHAVLVRLDPVSASDPGGDCWYHERDVTRL